ncbi:PQQ-dependent sugar dehydrogenase [Microbacterium aoyamense]|uniref:PQQ-dependent sugar dehydrogenase n=1 Tax=Microbacterium aoyamense TaxID=344166 RepID=A0ABN2P5P7_9MICO|nr:PQQ-dependent sugar dehydrogenase [Microbacterium aoyamense]
MKSARALAAASILLLAMTGCSAQPPDDRVPPSAAPTSAVPDPSPTETEEPVRTGTWTVAGEPTTIARALAAPWSVVPLEGGGALISERDSGVIRELSPDGTLRQAGVVPGVVAGNESGLHGLALRDGWLYAYHGAADDNRVVRMPLTGTAGSLALGEPEVVFTGIPRNTTHDGGRIAFGPDGFLYIATGDAQNRDAAQDPASLSGKILRVTADGDPARGNPFDSAVYSLGHRNVQGLAWTADGALWASEFGGDQWDELNRIEPGGNYGWPIVEGGAGDARFVDPVAQWATRDASPSGIAAVGDTVFMAALRGERLWAVDTTTGATAVAFDGQGRLRDAVAAPDGSLWVLTNNTDGRGAARDGDDVLLRLPLAPG